MRVKGTKIASTSQDTRHLFSFESCSSGEGCPFQAQSFVIVYIRESHTLFILFNHSCKSLNENFCLVEKIFFCPVTYFQSEQPTSFLFISENMSLLFLYSVFFHLLFFLLKKTIVFTTSTEMKNEGEG